jgi:hypothetical protein
MEKEVWVDIPSYYGLYQVSNLGRVKSFRKSKERILKLYIGSNGYYVVTLIDKKRIHQLVAMAFLGHTPDKTMKFVVDHINGNRLDNRLENLQVITQKENIAKSIRINKFKETVS